MSKEKNNAIVSVYDKTDLDKLTRGLTELDWHLFASGGTAEAMRQTGAEVADVSILAKGKELLGGRVKTLSRGVHAGLLAKDTSEDWADLCRMRARWLELACVNPYDLAKYMANSSLTYEQVLEMFDVGGPAMINAGIKGQRIVVTNPDQYPAVLDWLREGRPDDEEFRQELYIAAARVLVEDSRLKLQHLGGPAVSGFGGEQIGDEFKGENGGQRGAFYVDRYAKENPLALRNFKLHREEESELGYNNRTDVSRSMQTLTHIVAGFERNFGKAERYYGLGVKHGNPCGAGVAETPEEAIIKTIEGDQLALFGGTVTFNFPLDKELATLLMKHNQGAGKNLIDVVVVPGVTEEALEILHRKEGRLRVITNPALEVVDENSMDKSLRMQTTFGGDLLVQDNYGFVLDYSLPELERFGEASPQQLKDMLLAWAICATSNSNTITFVKDGMLIANAVGQQARVYAAELAVGRARRLNHDIKDVAVCSDSFFPFADGPQLLVDAGVGAIFTTRGSKKDQEVFEVFKKAGTVLYTLPDSMARGFSHHAA